MREIEKIFRAIRCTEDDKVTVATYMLQERADVWWSSLLRTRFEDGAVEVGWDEFGALSAACRQEGEMEQYIEEKKASQKRPVAPFQRQERKKVTFQSPQHPVASGSSQKLAGKCLKCGSSEHRIKDCPRLQQGGQRGTAPAAPAAAPVIGRPGRPRAPARVFTIAREDAEQVDHDMASRGRRGVPAREGEQRRDEPRREDQGEQQSPAPQGPVLPPPPPVDYGVFMQGLVQDMQTQAHTQAALQAQLEAQAQVPAPHADHGGPSIMERFKRMSPPSFKGESDPLLAES
ncbi:hypothetical protein Taro_005630 [Colocasia esculenta]|uniref:CCHC-type domain-containing protein n=1 Tax=Colocasia esculenta TaxID=4460 RepID=A0A843TV23_COLES|nr:hypothetical protein [Colocasia esculenta]